MVAVNVIDWPDFTDNELDVIDVTVDWTGGVNVIDGPDPVETVFVIVVLLDTGVEHGIVIDQFGGSPI